MDIQLINATDEIPEFSLNGKSLSAKVVSCYDGDTFNAVVLLDNKLLKFNCRMNGYDTPEIKPPKNKPDREIEKKKALKAKQALLSNIIEGITMNDMTKDEIDTAINLNKKIITLHCKEFDKYGRLLVEIQLNETLTVNEWMIINNYGYRYNGGTKDINFSTKV